jgi:hypothetical protein
MSWFNFVNLWRSELLNSRRAHNFSEPSVVALVRNLAEPLSSPGPSFAPRFPAAIDIDEQMGAFRR